MFLQQFVLGHLQLRRLVAVTRNKHVHLAYLYHLFYYNKKIYAAPMYDTISEFPRNFMHDDHVDLEI